MTSQSNEFQGCASYIYAALVEEQERRPRYEGVEWIENERLAIQKAANAWAMAHGLDTRITTDDVERIEVQAIGHVDYTSKLALYVAECIYEH